MTKILITGACGQLGSELTLELRNRLSNDSVVASDIREPQGELANGPFEKVDVMDKKAMQSVIKKHNITQIYHLAAILSAKGESNPGFAWHLNMESLSNVLELSKELSLDKIYWPSSIAVFGPNTPKNETPQHTIMDPNTVYGISKQAGERWCEYYHEKYGVDVRSLRYPGLIGYKTKPGGGTTDYAVEVFYNALEGAPYECFLREDTSLPMMYINDAIKATIDLMDADEENITVRSSYNIGAISFSPKELFEEIKKLNGEFEYTFKPDFRQKIADSWPNSIDDSQARRDWGWQHKYDLKKMTSAILKGLKRELKK